MQDLIYDVTTMSIQLALPYFVINHYPNYYFWRDSFHYSPPITSLNYYPALQRLRKFYFYLNGIIFFGLPGNKYFTTLSESLMVVTCGVIV